MSLNQDKMFIIIHAGPGTDWRKNNAQKYPSDLQFIYTITATAKYSRQQSPLCHHPFKCWPLQHLSPPYSHQKQVMIVCLLQTKLSKRTNTHSPHFSQHPHLLLYLTDSVKTSNYNMHLVTSRATTQSALFLLSCTYSRG